MLSFGMAAFTLSKELVGTFSRNLHLLEGARSDERTTAWWKTGDNAAAFARSREALVAPRQAMLEARAWLEAIRRFGRPVICGAPSGFDFTFLYYYFQRGNRRNAGRVRQPRLAQLRCRRSQAPVPSRRQENVSARVDR